jgi:hypothetical protein
VERVCGPPSSTLLVEHQTLQNDLVLLVLLEGQAVGPELALLAFVAGGASARQVRPEGLRRQEVVGLEDAPFDMQGRSSIDGILSIPRRLPYLPPVAPVGPLSQGRRS